MAPLSASCWPPMQTSGGLRNVDDDDRHNLRDSIPLRLFQSSLFCSYSIALPFKWLDSMTDCSGERVSLGAAGYEIRAFCAIRIRLALQAIASIRLKSIRFTWVRLNYVALCAIDTSMRSQSRPLCARAREAPSDSTLRLNQTRTNEAENGQTRLVVGHDDDVGAHVRGRRPSRRAPSPATRWWRARRAKLASLVVVVCQLKRVNLHYKFALKYTELCSASRTCLFSICLAPNLLCRLLLFRPTTIITVANMLVWTNSEHEATQVCA